MKINQLLPIQKFTNKQLNLWIALLAFIILCIGIKYRFSTNDANLTLRFIDGDGKGYYAYLPASLLYHDLSFSFYDENMARFGHNYTNTFLISHDSVSVNKYTCGEAVLLLPFFLLAMLWSWLFHMPMDGYNDAFQVFCGIGSLFYCVTGLIFTKKFLQQYNLSNVAIVIGLTALALGSNLLNYTVNESSMSHVFSFALIACHVFFVKRAKQLWYKNTFLIGLSLGLIALTRPVNGIIVLLYPFLIAGDFFLTNTKKNIYKHLALLIGVALLVFFIQLIIWKTETGHFFVFSYKNEGFYFNKPPHFFEYLLGFRKGAFIYSPVLLFSLVGFYVLYKQSVIKFIWLTIFVCVLVYVHSSWWSWYYGDSFGARPLVDFYVIFAFLIAFIYNEIKKNGLHVFVTIIFVLSIALHQVFFYQYYHSIIHPESMNYEKFKYVFFKTDKRHANLFKCGPEDFYCPKGIKVTDSAEIDFTKTDDKLSRFTYTKSNLQPAGYNIQEDNYFPQVIFTSGPGWVGKPRFAEFYMDYVSPNDSAACDIFFMVECLDSLGREKWFVNASALTDKYNLHPGALISAFERVKIGVPGRVGDKIEVYIFNPKNKTLLIKKLKIKIVEANV